MKRWGLCLRGFAVEAFKDLILGAGRGRGKRPQGWLGGRGSVSLGDMGTSAKTAAREEIRRRLSLLAGEVRRDSSLAIAEALGAARQWQSARTVGLYLSLPDEPETRHVIRKAWEEGKTVALPKTDIRHGLTWWEIQPGPLPSLETLWEPLPGKHAVVKLEAIDGFCVPGRAFDRTGTRLGRGGGHYDRVLAQRPRHAWVAGLFFGVQEMENLPREPHDVSLPHVITEKGWRSLLP
ncbi:MAG: 5-formyltetrahydrofolate cyclo-ligase [Verrucomicrobia bacterium]|nr:5-formyltetrahydrofolate cyclo-ligase [Verrucomicrobiota bacterium]NDC00126.1 5-formyltetrahydrofolate cyclo-ligase [Verrucomicrobiota bacterium]NDF16695.1 5-formyltetrahydrofolate cyclo-ligase [Verrucomicrobiota bacterium]